MDNESQGGSCHSEYPRVHFPVYSFSFFSVSHKLQKDSSLQRLLYSTCSIQLVCSCRFCRSLCLTSDFCCLLSQTCGCGCCGEVAASHPAGPPLRTGQDEGIQAGHSLQVTQRVGGSPGLTPNTAPPVGNASTQCSQCAPRLQAEAPPTCQRCGWKNQQAAILFLKFIYPGSGCSEHAHFQLNPAACVQL